MPSSPYDGLYWENSIPLGLHYLLQDITKQTAKDPNTPDVWTPSSEREWLSLPRGAKSYTLKHNIFTFPDAGNFFNQEGKRTTVGNNNLTPDYGDDLDYGQPGYGSQIARSLNPDYFNWVPIAYNSYAFPLNVSVNAAVDRAVNIINATPGKIFLIGQGQGAMVASRLYNEFRSGRLTSRRSDLLGVYNFGNPLRQAGRGIPGGPASGHGMAPFSQRLAGTEDLVWEFARPDDPIATQQDDNKGEWATSIYNALNQQVTGPDSLIEQIIELVFNPIGEIPALLTTLFSDIQKQFLGNGGAHNNYQNFYPIPGSNLNAIDTAVKNIVDLSVRYPPETLNKPLTEALTINYRQPVSVSEISFEVLRNSVTIELWFQDRLNKWRQVTTEDSVPITLTLGATDSTSWYKFHTSTYPIVAKAIQFRATRVYDPLVGESPYCVGLKNILVRRNVYDRAAGLQSIDDEQDALGNVITKSIKDWDAPKAIDDSATTFWRSAPQPDPNAVVSLYLDMRDANGNAQSVDKVYIDPVYTGQALNLYYSNDETAISRKLNPTSLQPDETQQHYEWTAGKGLRDATINDSEISQYQVPFSVGPMVSQDCWIGIQWTPSFTPYAQKVTSYSFNVTNKTVTLTGVTSPTLANIQSIYDTTTNTLLYSKSRDMGSSSFNTSTKVLTLPSANVAATCANTDTLEIYYGTTGPAPTQLVLFETVPDNTSGTQYWPKVYYDVGSATIKLQLLNLTNGTPILYTAPIAPLFEANTPLHIVVGWTYSGTNPKVSIQIRNNRGLQLSSYEATDGNFPKNITLDGKIKYKNWRGTFGAHIVKQESYTLSSASFLENPSTYTNPEPILLSKNGTVPASSLDEAVMASDWTMQQFAAGGAHTSSYSDKEWTPIWSNYFTEKGFLYLPRTTQMKYLKMEFSQLTAEPYPIYDQGIKVTYQVYPVTITQTQPPKKPGGLLGVLSNIANAIGSINWLNPSTIGKAVNSIFGRTVQPVQTTLQIGPGYTTNALPNTTQTAVAESTRTEANSPWVYRRTPISPFGLVQNFLGTLFGQNTSQSRPSIPSVQQSMISSQTKMTPPVSATPATLPIQGQDWYVFPGQTLRMPAAVIEGITKSQVVTRRDVDKSVRTRFDFTAVHKYETKTVTLDAAIAYFAGIREVQPYVATYEDEEDPPEFKFDSYDSKVWSLSNINQLDTGPITANSNPYVVNNGGFDLNISEWTATGNWNWDNSEGHTVKDTWQPGIPLIYGAAHTTANSQNQTLVSSPIAVTAGDQINFSAWVVYKGINSTASGKISVDAIGLNGTTVIADPITFQSGSNLQISNPTGSSIAVYGVKAIHLYGTATVPSNVNNLKVRLKVNNTVSAGDIYFDDIELTPTAGVVGSAYKVINTKGRFSRLHCEFTNSGLRRSDSMWALATGNYLATIPATVYNTVAASGNGTRATLTLDGPPDFLSGSQITVSGMTPSEYNGVWTVFAVSTTAPYTVSFNCTATGNQTVAGTVVENRSESPSVALTNTNASRTALAYYTETIPSNIPDGMWADTFGSWGYSTPALYQQTQSTTPVTTASGNEVKWGTPFSTVSIQIDPNMVYDKKRVIHFYRASKRGDVATGEAGIRVRQETNFVSDGLFRICARWYKAKKTNNTVKLRLRRVSGDDGGGLYPNGYVYQETVGGADTPVPTGYWYTHQTKWAKIPTSQDQTYVVEFVLDGDQEDDIYLNDLWVEISQIRYHVRLGGGTDHDVTALAYTDNCTVGTTVPVSQMELSTTIYGDRSFAYTSKFTPLYLK